MMTALKDGCQFLGEGSRQVTDGSEMVVAHVGLQDSRSYLAKEVFCDLYITAAYNGFMIWLVLQEHSPLL